MYCLIAFKNEDQTLRVGPFATPRDAARALDCGVAKQRELARVGEVKLNPQTHGKTLARIVKIASSK